MIRKAETIIAEVAAKHGLTARDLLEKSRFYHIAHPRQEAYARVRRELQLSLPQVADIFDRDHTTILTGIQQHDKRQAGHVSPSRRREPDEADRIKAIVNTWRAA